MNYDKVDSLIEDYKKFQKVNRSTSYSLWAKEKTGFNNITSRNVSETFEMNLNNVIKQLKIEGPINNKEFVMLQQIEKKVFKQKKILLEEMKLIDSILDSIIVSLFRIEFTDDETMIKECFFDIERNLLGIINNELVFTHSQAEKLKYVRKKFSEKNILMSINLNKIKVNNSNNLLKSYQKVDQSFLSTSELQVFKEIVIRDIIELSKSLINVKSDDYEVIIKNPVSYLTEKIKRIEGDKIPENDISVFVTTKEGRFVVPDVGFFNKFFLNTETHGLVLNKQLLNRKMTKSQLDVIFVHEVYPGHYNHWLRGLSGINQNILDIFIDKVTLEGWALFCENNFLEKSENNKAYLLQRLRRYLSGLLTVNDYIGINRNDNFEEVKQLIKKSSLINYSEYFSQSIRINQSVLKYIMGEKKIELFFQKIDDYEFFLSLGPVSLEILQIDLNRYLTI